jgi:hypothetical protein
MELFHSTKCQGREACICFKSYLLNGHGGMEEYGHTLLKKFTEGREISCFCCDDTPQLDIILLMPCCNQKTHKTCVLTWLKSNRPYCRKVVNILPPKWWYCCPTLASSCAKILPTTFHHFHQFLVDCWRFRLPCGCGGTTWGASPDTRLIRVLRQVT